LERFVPTWMKTAPSSAATNPPTRRSASVIPSAVPTSTGAMAAGSVRGRAAMSQMRTEGPYGRRGNFEKSGRRFST
jgi:hypothetical protein